MKDKQKKAKKPPKNKPKPELSKGKRSKLEAGARIALIGAIVLFVAVFGIGCYFAVRSVISDGINPPDLAYDSEESLEITPPDDITAPDDISDLFPLPDPEADDAPAIAAIIPPIVDTGLVIRPRGTLIFVIDDAGNNLRDLQPFLQFPGPITIAVLPGLANSVESARLIRAAGKELILHQPMEPLSGRDPGPEGIKMGMTPDEAKEIIRTNLNEVGPVAGFNNHEGSRVTMDPVLMQAILEVSRDSALFFLDSRTTADSVAPQIAREIGIRIAQRDIFLDNEQDRASILAALENGLRRAEQNGTAIFIGHTWSPLLAGILTEMYPQLIRQGFVFSTIGALLEQGK